MTTDELLKAIKIRASLPTFQGNTWDDPSIIASMNEESRTSIVPAIVKASEDYLVDFVDIPLLAGVSSYSTPARALSSVVRKLCYLDTAGNEGPPLRHIPLTDIGQWGIVTPGNPPFGFFFTAEAFTLVPAPASGVTGSIRCYYLRRPSDLVARGGTGLTVDTAVAVVQSVTSDTAVLLGGLGHNGFLSGAKADILQADPPHRLRAYDLQLDVTGASTSINRAAGGFSALGLSPGDFVTLARTSMVPMVPDEFHVLLELKVAARIMDTLGDEVGAASVNAQAGTVSTGLLNLISPRAKGNPVRFSAWRNW